MVAGQRAYVEELDPTASDSVCRDIAPLSLLL